MSTKVLICKKIEDELRIAPTDRAFPNIEAMQKFALFLKGGAIV